MILRQCGEAGDGGKRLILVRCRGQGMARSCVARCCCCGSPSPACVMGFEVIFYGTVIIQVTTA